MDTSTLLAQLSICWPLALGAIGSGLGIMNCGRAAMGEWAKEGKEGKTLRFGYIIFTAMPLSQVLYGFLFTFLALREPVAESSALVSSHGGALFAVGLACGLAELASGWAQGILGAAGCRTFSDGDGKGLTNIVIVMGIVETIGLFGFVFAWLLMPTL